MNIVKIILNAMPEDAIAEVAKGTGTSEVEAKSVLGAAVPAIMGVIGDRARTDKKGTQNMLASVMGATGAKSASGSTLDTVLGSAKDSVIKDVMKKAGIKDSGLVGKIIEGLVPKVFESLQKKGISLTQIMTIATTLSVLKGDKRSTKSTLGKLDGSMLTSSLGKKGDVAGMAGKMLGGLFKK